MSFLPRQVVRGFSMAIALLSLDLICSCKPTTSSPREDLARSLGGANLEGFEFATKEAGAEEISSFTNPAVRKLITLGGGDKNLVLRYTRISTRAANAAKTYKTEIARQGAALTLLVTDLGTNEIISKEAFPAPAPGHGGGFETLNDCLKEFDCVNGGALRCEANRTCKDQFAAITCCLKSGECFSVHLIFRPTRPQCALLEQIPELEGLVLSQ